MKAIYLTGHQGYLGQCLMRLLTRLVLDRLRAHGIAEQANHLSAAKSDK